MPTSSPTASAERQPGNAVRAFFDAIPKPEYHYSHSITDIVPILVKALRSFNLSASERELDLDPDCRLIKAIEVSVVEDPIKQYTVMYEQLARLAMAKIHDPSDSTAMAKQLRYLAWVVAGRKDQSCPFLLSSPPGTTAKQCACCGNQEASLKCTGCLISEDNCASNQFATVYCNQDCQKKHWKAHRDSCRQVCRLTRAVSMFNEVFRHMLSSCHESRFAITSIDVEGDMVVVRAASSVDARLDVWWSFPTSLAATPMIGTAVSMHRQSDAPMGDAHAFFEFLVGGKALPL